MRTTYNSTGMYGGRFRHDKASMGSSPNASGFRRDTNFKTDGRIPGSRSPQNSVVLEERYREDEGRVVNANPNTKIEKHKGELYGRHCGRSFPTCRGHCPFKWLLSVSTAMISVVSLVLLLLHLIHLDPLTLHNVPSFSQRRRP